MISPSLEAARTLIGSGTVLPVYRTILADTETPVSVWMKLFRTEPRSFLLESVTGGEQVARYSCIGGNPFMTFRSNGTSWRIDGARKESGDGDPIGALRRSLKAFVPVHVDGLPRFCAGAVGYLSYDAVRLYERVPDKNPRDGMVDDIFFGFYRDLVVFDNKEHRLLLLSNIIRDDAAPFERAYKEAAARVGALEDRLAVRLTSTHVTIKPGGEPQSNCTREDYERAVERCKEYIAAGDIFQVVLSQRFAVPVDADPFDLYRILRVVNPSPYMYFLALDGAHIIGASPEMLVRVENGAVETRPIAGSRWRGASEAEDQRLADELLHDPKELAEHVMLVDLGRNDVGRVSVYGSVRADNLMHVEKYSHVMHMVTNVSGRLKEGHDALDALFACFPAGTLSGAPKIRAMEIIDELEPLRRGIYGGTLGYIDFSGNLDSCIIIRTILYKDGMAYIQAGAGIVADSVPSREYDETVNKAKALFTAISEAGAIVG